jgi:hypothetical protein
MDQSKLIMMANQIARNLQHHEESEAIGELVSHISLYWTRQMIAQLLMLDQSKGLDPLVIKAFARLKENV